MRHGVIGSAAFAAAAVAAASATPAVAAAGTPAGDWEAHGAHGALGSFALGTVKGLSELSDLALEAPVSCTNAAGTPVPVDVDVVPGTFALGKGDGFAVGELTRRRGGTKLTARRVGGRYVITYRHVTRTANPYQGGTQVCDTGTVHLTARRGHRRTLKDGVWHGRSAKGEQVELSVVAGGRALETPAGPGATASSFSLGGSSSANVCGYELDAPLFIGPNGTFSNVAIRLGDEAVVTGRFTKPAKVSGTFSNLQEACSQEKWTAGFGR